VRAHAVGEPDHVLLPLLHHGDAVCVTLRDGASDARID
jgi:hypothetical protein